MIDFHTHVLPGIDDGSDSTETSLGMLEESARAGVKIMIATPHFYAEKQHPESFLSARAASYRRLMEQRASQYPFIILGAEVFFFDGMSRSEYTPQLCIQGTDLILLEMPMTKWTHRMIDEVLELNYEQPVTIVLAHIERYMDKQPESIWDTLRSHDILTQVNANFFIRPKTRRKALSMLEKGEIDLLGSDCHNMTSRLPNMGEAVQVVEASLGAGGKRALVYRGRELLMSHRLSEPQA